MSAFAAPGPAPRPAWYAAPATGYIPALDGLRAAAIVLVVASHAGLDHLVPGAFGVTLFFFISGYLITRQLLASLVAGGNIGLGGFFLRRVLRLAPAALSYTVVAGLAFAAAGGHITPTGWLAAMFYGANVYDLWVGYRSTLIGVRHPFNILWSLAIEEHFYALWPLILPWIWRQRASVGVLLLLCLAILAWRAFLFDRCGGPGWPALCGRVQQNPLWQWNRLYLGSDTRLDSIGWGALLALAEQRGQRWVSSATQSRPRQMVACLVLAGSFAMPGSFMHHVVRTTLQGAALLILVPAVLGQDHAVKRVLSAPAAILIGRLSYSLYLWHWGAFAAADALAGSNRPLWLAIGLPLAVVAATASYLAIEQPMLRLRRRAGSHAPRAMTPADVGQETSHAAN